MTSVPDFSTQLEFYFEQPRAERTYSSLKGRIQELVDRDQQRWEAEGEAGWDLMLGRSSSSLKALDSSFRCHQCLLKLRSRVMCDTIDWNSAGESKDERWMNRASLTVDRWECCRSTK